MRRIDPFLIGVVERDLDLRRCRAIDDDSFRLRRIATLAEKTTMNATYEDNPMGFGLHV